MPLLATLLAVQIVMVRFLAGRWLRLILSAIAAGGFVAFRVGSNSEADGELDNGKVETTLRADLGLNNVLYGVTGQIGYKKFRVYVNYYLNNLFAEDTPYDFTVMNVGVAFF